MIKYIGDYINYYTNKILFCENQLQKNNFWV